MNISSVGELTGLLKQARHSNWKEEMRDNESVRTCPSCGKHRQHRHGTGRFIMWTPCPFCSNIRKYPKAI